MNSRSSSPPTLSVAYFLESMDLLQVPGLRDALEAQADDVRDLSLLRKDEVDNLLAAASVRQRVADGAKILRIECDFVTCSQ